MREVRDHLAANRFRPAGLSVAKQTIANLIEKASRLYEQGLRSPSPRRFASAAVDLLKIDVEGHFMEVLEGIAPADKAKVRNIVLETQYTEALGSVGVLR